MKNLTLLLLAIALAACTVATPQPTAPTATPDYSSLQITLERTACFGTCPIYKLTIHGDGLVEYDGERFVTVTGHQTSQLTSDQVVELTTLFQQADYFNLKSDYTAPVTDLPSTITSLSFEGRSKKVTNYGGCLSDLNASDKAPQALCDLEGKIDSIVNSAQWVGVH